MSFRIFFQGSSFDGKTKLSEDFECATLMVRAETFLTSLIKSVEERTVTVATLKLLEEKFDQFIKLGEIWQMNQNHEISIQVSFSERLSELKAFFAYKDDLECFIHFSNIFTSGN